MSRGRGKDWLKVNDTQSPPTDFAVQTRRKRKGRERERDAEEDETAWRLREEKTEWRLEEEERIETDAGEREEKSMAESREVVDEEKDEPRTE